MHNVEGQTDGEGRDLQRKVGVGGEILWIGQLQREDGLREKDV